MRDTRVVEIVSRVDMHIDTKADFHEKANLEPLFEALQGS